MLTQEQMSTRVGKKRSTISNYLRLLKLDPIIQTGIRDGFISMGHGRALVTIEKKEDQLKLYEKILTKSISVREAEKLADNFKKPKKSLSRKYKIKEPFNYELKKLKKTYNSEVKIKLNGEEKGFIIIPFNNIEDFKEINKKLNGNK